ncbi:MAG: bacterial transcriptional activator domain-containing protein [Candidatus Bathyarchaeia archaeon]|nr:bacterial transcriptional activator domain-containing protein [Candidatus Bathyarchaeota archaeon]
MTAAKRQGILGREELVKIIETCQSIENKGLNPFLINVDDLVSVIRQYFPNWSDPEELCLDAEALNKIATVIKMQSEWIKQRATSLYRDPFLVEEKLRSLPIERIAEIFMEAWHPLVELEQITMGSLEAALRYWSELAPLDERWQRENLLMAEISPTSREELIRQGILLSETFTEELEKLWNELKTVAKNQKIKYWDFIGSKTYQETVRRAYLTSFLITYGYAALEINPLEEEIFLQPFEKPVLKENTPSFSFPISISFEEWNRWRQTRER